MFIVIMLWAASIDGHLFSLVACHCTDLYLFNLDVHLANKLSLPPFPFTSTPLPLPSLRSSPPKIQLLFYIYIYFSFLFFSPLP